VHRNKLLCNENQLDALISQIYFDVKLYRMVLVESCMTYTIAECTENKLLMMDRGTSETCRVSCQNKFVKLVHLVGFYYKEICYDARSHERKKKSL